jgi:hypothetical protein
MFFAREFNTNHLILDHMTKTTVTILDKVTCECCQMAAVNLIPIHPLTNYSFGTSRIQAGSLIQHCKSDYC